MTEKEFGNFGQWSLKELIEKERSFTVGDRRGAELRAEIDRRLAQQKRRRALVAIIAAIASTLAATVTVVYGLDRGIFIGSTTTRETSDYRLGAGVNESTETYNGYTRFVDICSLLESWKCLRRAASLVCQDSNSRISRIHFIVGFLLIDDHRFLNRRMPRQRDDARTAMPIAAGALNVTERPRTTWIVEP